MLNNSIVVVDRMEPTIQESKGEISQQHPVSFLNVLRKIHLIIFSYILNMRSINSILTSIIISILFFSCVSSPRYKDVSSPRDKDVYHYIRIKDYDSAVKLIEEQIKSGNEVKRNFALYDKTSLLSEGKGYKKNVDEAEKILKTLIKNKSKHLNELARIKLSKLYITKQEIDKASELLEYNFKGEKTKLLVLNAYEEIYKNTQEHEKLIKTRLEIIDIYLKNNDFDAAGTRFVLNGYLYRDLKDYKSAIAGFEKASNTYKKSGNFRKYNGARLNMAKAHEDLKSFGIAENIYFEIINQVKSSKDYKTLAKAYDNLSFLYFRQHKFKRSEEYVLKTIDILQDVDNFTKLTILNNLVVHYQFYKMCEKAIKYSKMGYEIAQEEDSSFKTLFLAHLIECASMSKNKRLYKDLLRDINLESINDFLLERQISGMELKNGNENYYKQFVSKYIKQDLNAVEKSLLYNLMAAYHDKNKNYAKAIQYFDKSNEYAKPANQINIQIGNYLYLGAIHTILDKYDDAEQYLVQAIKYQKLANKSSDPIKMLTRQDKESIIYYNLIYLFYKSKNIPKLIIALEGSKSNILHDWINSHNETNIEDIIKSLPDKECYVLYGLFNTPHAFVVGLAKDAYIVKKLNSRTLGLNDREREVDVAETINEYYKKISSPNKNVRGVKVNAKTSDIYKKDSNRLYEYLIAPINQFIEKYNTVNFIPDKQLHILPFETLIDNNGQYLIEKYNIKYSPSIRIDCFLKHRKSLGSRFLAIGDPVYSTPSESNQFSNEDKEILVNYLRSSKTKLVFDEKVFQRLSSFEWTPLEGAREELKYLRDKYNFTLLSRENANSNLIRQYNNSGELERFKIIHFATHGFVFPSVPEFSALVLSQSDEPEAGYLTVENIQKFKLNSDLVMLSACETGLGKLFSGEGIFGLRNAFFMAGSHAVCSTLWSVEDNSTLILMKNFYDYVFLNNNDYSTALRKNKLKFIQEGYGKKYSHPYYWAPFIYYGKN
jgi:CHAT domain-containing protein